MEVQCWRAGGAVLEGWMDGRCRLEVADGGAVLEGWLDGRCRLEVEAEVQCWRAGRWKVQLRRLKAGWVEGCSKEG